MRYLSILFLIVSSYAFAADKHTTVTSAFTKNAKDLSFTIKVQPVPGKNLVMNYEGPWSLKIVDNKGLNVKEKRLTLKDFDKTSQEFKFTAQAMDKVTTGELKLEVTAFVCTEDKKTKEKTDCYRDVHAQNLKWTL